MEYIKVQFSDLLGKVIVKIDNPNDEKLYFHTDDNIYMMFHESDCCEQVYIDDICGELDDLTNSPVLLAEEVLSNDNPFDSDKKRYIDDSYTWTFYKLATVKGYVTIKWFGTSNGYYSERVDFVKIIECEPTIKYGRNN